MAPVSPGPWLGAGVGFRRHQRAELLARGPGPGCRTLELIPEHFYGDLDALDALADAFELVIHGVGLSMGTPLAGAAEAPLTARLEALGRLAARCKPRLVTDHLATTLSPEGVDLGHLGPVPLTEAGRQTLCDRIRDLQDRVEAPVALEITAQPFELPGATLDLPTLTHQLVEATGCGLLMDLTNVLYNSRNFGFDPYERLAAYPLEAVWQVHLAGGHQAPDGWWVDAHDRAVGEESVALLDALAARAPLMTIIVERDDRYPPPADLIAEAAWAEDRWLSLQADQGGHHEA